TVESGSMSIGKKASNEMTEVIPLEENFARRTSIWLTRVSSKSPRVPSRDSLLIVSQVTKLAAQQSRNAAPTRPPNALWPICPCVAKGMDQISGGAQTKTPAAPTINRPQ